MILIVVLLHTTTSTTIWVYTGISRPLSIGDVQERHMWCQLDNIDGETGRVAWWWSTGSKWAWARCAWHWLTTWETWEANVQKKADDAQPSRSMGAVVRVLRLERSRWVNWSPSQSQHQQTIGKKKKKEGGGTHTIDRLASLWNHCEDWRTQLWLGCLSNGSCSPDSSLVSSLVTLLFSGRLTVYYWLWTGDYSGQMLAQIHEAESSSKATRKGGKREDKLEATRGLWSQQVMCHSKCIVQYVHVVIAKVKLSCDKWQK
jgi:hypothetical protein